jgi:hypothetical protein
VWTRMLRSKGVEVSNDLNDLQVSRDQ